MKTHGIKALDLAVLLAFAIALLASVLSVRRGRGAERLLAIRTPEGEFVYPLSKDAVYRVEGAAGVSEIEVRNGKASFKDSPCPSKTCVLTGEISEAGEWAACLPNEIFIIIEGNSSELDVVSR